MGAATKQEGGVRTRERRNKRERTLVCKTAGYRTKPKRRRKSLL